MPGSSPPSMLPIFIKKRANICLMQTPSVISDNYDALGKKETRKGRKDLQQGWSVYDSSGGFPI
jgi:hypothetical protein